MSEPKLHHFVPKFHLRRFANELEQVCVRSRDGKRFTTSIRNVAAVSGLYRVPGQRPTAEYSLGDFEGEAAKAIEQLLSSGSLPRSGSSEHQAIALLMALQLSRSPDDAKRIEFALDVADTVDERPVSMRSMRAYLQEWVLGFEPADPEVRSACDWVNYLLDQPDMMTRDEAATFRLQTMFDRALRIIAPHLQERMWSLEVSREVELITSDRPVTLWHPPSHEDRFRGIGVVQAAEIWFPLDPTRMLVLRPSGVGRTKRIGPERVMTVNAHMARHCTERLMYRPGHKLADQLSLSTRRPTIRFWEAPAFNGATGQPLPGEVMHIWFPIRDVPDDGTERSNARHRERHKR